MSHLFQWNETQEAIKKLHVLLKCGVCDALPVDPVVLPECHHSFCSVCLRERPSCSSTDPHQCPMCGKTASHLPSSTHPDNLTVQLCDALQDLQSLLTSNSHLPRPAGAPVVAQEGSATRDHNRAPAPPVETSAALGATRLKPTVPKSTPTKPQSKPTATQSKPVIQPKPATPQSKPTTQPKPSTPHSKPTATQPKPSTPQPKPTTTQLKSITHRLSPTTHKRETVTQNTPTTPEVTPAGSRCVPATPKLDRRNLKGETALHSACVKGDEQLVRRLLQEGANPNCRDHAGWTPLHEACQHGHVTIAEELLRAGALPNVPGYEGNATPLHDAVEHGREMVIVVLRRYGARDDIRDMYGNTARHLVSLCRAPGPLLAAINTPPDAELMQQVRCAGPPQHSIVVTGSNLTPDQAKQLHHFARLFRIRVVAEYL
ncbi:Ankyrin repeat-containing domain [Trinorchestia longiramus]|nr:Ankyrin repeat-containing domain [Trinorchestia longiramus]